MKRLITFATILLILFTVSAFSANVTFSGGISYTDLNNLALKGNYALCAMDYGLMILEISDYTSPQFVTIVYQAMEYPRGIVLSGDYAYMYSTNNIYIYNVADELNPFYVDSFSISCIYVLAHGNTLYVCRQGGDGLTMVDISDPVNPVIDVTYPTTGTVSSITRLSGDSLYCISTTGGLEIINYKGIGFVQTYASNLTLGQLHDVASWNDRIYAVSTFDSVMIFETPDFNDLTNIVGVIHGNFYKIAVDDSIAYIGGSNEGIKTYNVADPENISLISDISYYGRFAIRDSLLTIVHDAEVWFYDTEELGHLNYLGKYSAMSYDNDLVLSDTTVYLAGRHFAIMDISNIDGNPEFIGMCYLDHGLGLTIQGSYAFVICADSTVKTIDMTDPFNPEVTATLPIADRLEGIASHGSYVYVSSSNSNLYIINASTPTSLSVTNTISMGLYYNEIKIRDGFLYAGELAIYDLTDPVNPSLAGSPINTGFSHDLTIDSIWACYAIAYSEPYMGAITIYNVEDPESPFQIGGITLQHETRGIAVDYPHAFLATYGFSGTDVMYIIDISDPSNPDSIGMYTSGYEVFYNIEHRSERLYIASNYGLTILKYYDICGDVNGDGKINVGDPIFYVNWIFRGGPAPFDLIIADVNCDNHENIGDAVYMINHVFKGGDAPCADCPLNYSIKQNYPNPFNSATTLNTHFTGSRM